MNKKLIYLSLWTLSCATLHTDLFAQSSVFHLKGGSQQDAFYQVDVSQQGDAIFAAGGTSSSDGDLTAPHPGSDLWLLKVSATDAAVLWQRSYGGAGREGAQDITPALNGDLFITGTTDSVDGDITEIKGLTDIWIARLDPSGNLLWQKTLGGSNYDAGNTVLALPDGGCAVIGLTYSDNGDVVGMHGSSDIWVVRLDAQGNIVWSKALGGTLIDYLHSARLSTTGDILIAGSSTSIDGDLPLNRGEADAWIVRLSLQGDIVWSRTFGGTNYDEATYITDAPDGGYYVGGMTASNDGDITFNYGSLDAWLLKANAMGTLEWNTTYGGLGDEFPVNLQLLNDGRLVLVGNTTSNDGLWAPNHGEWDIFTTVVQADGTLESVKLYGGSATDFVRGACTTASGLVLVGESESNDGAISGNHGMKDALIFTLGNAALYPQEAYNERFRVRAYPNPADSKLYFDRPISGRIFTATGEPVTNFSQVGHVDISQLLPGTYFVRVLENSQVVRFVKTKR